MATTARPYEPSPGRSPVTLARARQALHAGTAVVLPNDAPLTHVVTATRARTVNEAKGRPPDQPVALWAHHPDTLAALDQIWDLAPATADTARRLLAAERLTVLVPLRHPASVPPWLTPAAKDGWTLLFGARPHPLSPLLDEHPVLYVSSANRTGHPPAATTADALRMFPPGVAVLEPPDPEPAPASPGPPRRATTTVRLHPDGRLQLHRPGAQDQHAPGPDDYLRHLRERYPAVHG
ncbi:Sua5/YciO/YrdC/YwlC family protein [Streptomyces sp. NPDC047000]|uniref:Sua5/YciO/YrdC/YwlC family protein n=1 Tax=Streptomyces sp. NPDC047000 TaxID=3155474 RepID=UPI0033EEE4CF